MTTSSADKAQRRLTLLRNFLEHLREKAGLDLGFRLWDGSRVPKDLPDEALAIVIADEGAAAGLLRKPGIETIANLWAARRIDIVNGTLFDLAARRPRIRTRDFRKAIDIGLALKTALGFLLVPRGGPWPLETIGKDAASDGSKAQNKKNIAYHYDVSNDFYRLWLDEAMVYSCAYFHEWTDSLDQAQFQKLDMTCRKLRLEPGDRLLDIGCGWGGLVIHAARYYGATALGCSLSEEQVAFAARKVERLGLSDRCAIALQDYSLIEGEGIFDKICSIGMLEHVGIGNYPKYFSTVNRLLRPGGLYLNHAITRPGKSVAARARHKKRPEFAALTRYIFPGGELDSIGHTIGAMELHGFEIHDVEGWREHYQRTCAFWHDRLLARYDEACAAVGEATTRVWLAYLAACAISFSRNNVGLYQTIASKRVKGPMDRPPTRAAWYLPTPAREP